LASFAFPGTGDPEGALPTQWFSADQITTMFRSADHAIITLPRTPKTLNLIGERELDALPPHAFFVNVGRGGTVDETALFKRLQAGQLAGAALDVFADEPLDRDNPLWRARNTIITPHIGSYTSDQVALAGEVLIENVRRDLAGQPLLNLVNFAAGY
jgi:phosphoglycerate dehydrogenase-like enzyme